MRLRAVFVGLVLVLVTVAGVAGPAGADELPATEAPAADIGHAEEECIHLLEQGEPVDRCQEAPGRILPPIDEIIWGSLAFIVLIAALIKFARPAIKRGLAARSEKIQAELDAAEQARTSAESALEAHRRELGDGSAAASKIVQEAHDQAQRLRDEVLARAQADAAEILARNSEQTQVELGRLVDDMQSHVSRLALDLAERVVQANMDPATQERLVEQYISTVGARS